ncbi:MAG: hypothetical protein Tsb0014_17950 [Pleurocapsa sp.]
MGDVKEIKDQLQQNLAKILAQLKEAATVSVEDYFTSEEYQRGDLLKKADIKTRNILLSNLSDLELFPKWVSENLKSGLEYRSAGVVSFKTEAEASAFAEQAVVWAKERLETLLLQVRQETETEIKQASVNLGEFLLKETKPIIEQAKSRLQTVFEIDLDLPPPVIPTEEEITLEKQVVKTKSRLVDNGYEERLVKTRAWYYWFGIVPFYKQQKYERPYKKEDYYTVSVHELVEQINLASEKFVDIIQEKIIVYLDSDIQAQVNIFFDKLDNYLSGYLHNLQQAQVDKKLSLEQREKLSNNLVRLVPQATNCLNKANRYLEKTQKLLIEP